MLTLEYAVSEDEKKAEAISNNTSAIKKGTYCRNSYKNSARKTVIESLSRGTN